MNHKVWAITLTLERVLCLEDEEPELLLESSMISGACLNTSQAKESGYPNSRITRFCISVLTKWALSSERDYMLFECVQKIQKKKQK